MIRILKTSEYHKLDWTKQRIVDKACEKLETQINNIGKENFTTYMRNYNNPVIHDSYRGFYLYKFVTKSYSIRILYLYKKETDTIEIHRIHFKKGDRDNSKYIDDFEAYTAQYSFV